MNTENLSNEAENPTLNKSVDSGMYVNEDGILMCGPNGMSTSIVAGIRCECINEDTVELLIQPINDLGNICGEYYR